MIELKRAAVIGELSGAGKCALNAALPILAAAGIETCAVPTAVMAARTSDGGCCARRDLTANAPSMILRWKGLGLQFDAIACMPSGVGGMKAALAFADAFARKDCLLLVDPQMGQTAEKPDGIEELCGKAGLIAPDVREAEGLLGEKPREGPYDRDYIEHLLHGLCSLGPAMAVVKGVWFSPDLLGAASLDCTGETVSYAFSPRLKMEDTFGAGDVFSASLLAAMLNGLELPHAMQLAVDFTANCIRLTRESFAGFRFGLNFEAALPRLMCELGLARP